jgi:hypothetical protein
MSQENGLLAQQQLIVTGRGMKTYWTTMAVLLIALISLTSFAGCGSGKKAPTPEQKEEQRQKMIKNAERERREG